MNKNEKIIWIYSQWKWNFWFVDIEGQAKWYFIYDTNKSWALDWDKVEAYIKIFKWKKEAVITKVLERKTDLIVWELIDNWQFWFVISKNKQLKNDIFVSKKNYNNGKNWDIVWVQITKWTKKNPEWTIKEIVWKSSDKYIDLLSIIVEWWARLKFSQKVLKNANKFALEIPEHIKSKRKNLTWLFTFTIDWEDAKDLDDAISVEKDWDNYKLYVHIADVSHYVQEKSELDKEAYKRATSIYLVDRVVPMLPEKISNDLCSLNPNVDKLTLTCEMLFNSKWQIIEQKVYESVINSNFRLTYKDVDLLMNSEKWIMNNGLFFKQKITEELVEKIKISEELKNKISMYKAKFWVLNFEFPETKILLDKNKKVINIKEYPKYESNKIIEEFMISANESVSKFFSKLPFLYRIHEEPKQEDIIDLQNKLNLFEVKFQFKKWDSKEFALLLKQISSLEESKRMFIEKMVLRTLTKAVYSKENFGHFGLWLSFYSHFTSPIRRYPDLQIHRIIKEKLNKKLDKKRLFHYENILDKVANHTSTRERKAEKLEYKVRDYFIVDYYSDKVWQSFDWIITWVIPKWFFVWLEDTAEWFVEMINSNFNEDLQEHLDFKSWKKYRIWDKIHVKLIEVDKELLRLNFSTWLL